MQDCPAARSKLGVQVPERLKSADPCCVRLRSLALTWPLLVKVDCKVVLVSPVVWLPKLREVGERLKDATAAVDPTEAEIGELLTVKLTTACLAPTDEGLWLRRIVQDCPGAREVVQDSRVTEKSAALVPVKVKVDSEAAWVFEALLLVRVRSVVAFWPTLSIPKL